MGTRLPLPPMLGCTGGHRKVLDPLPPSLPPSLWPHHNNCVNLRSLFLGGGGTGRGSAMPPKHGWLRRAPCPASIPPPAHLSTTSLPRSCTGVAGASSTSSAASSATRCGRGGVRLGGLAAATGSGLAAGGGGGGGALSIRTCRECGAWGGRQGREGAQAPPAPVPHALMIGQ